MYAIRSYYEISGNAVIMWYEPIPPCTGAAMPALPITNTNNATLIPKWLVNENAQNTTELVAKYKNHDNTANKR